MYFLLHEIQYQEVDIFSIFDALDALDPFVKFGIRRLPLSIDHG